MVAQGAAEAEIEIVAEHQVVAVEIAAQRQPALQRVAGDQLAKRDEVRRVAVAQLHEIEQQLALGRLADRIGVVDLIPPDGGRADAGATREREHGRAKETGGAMRHAWRSGIKVGLRPDP